MPTILTAKKGVSLAKTFTPEGVESYGSAKYFSHSPLKTSDIYSLSAALMSLENTKNSCVIRGSFNPAANLPEFTDGKLIQRKKALFTDEPLHWVMLDVDSYPTTLPAEEAIAAFISNELPSGFHNRTYHYQLSSSYGTKGNEGLLKAHLWFWLATPYDSTILREWAKTLPILDYSVYNTVHIHYTAAPVFKGVPDPVAKRSGLVEGLIDEVKLVIEPVVRTLPDFVPEYVIDTEWPLPRISREILPNISPDITNDEWVKVGMALHHQGSGGSEWLQAFDEWSANGQSYEEDVCSIRWGSFYRDSGAKVGIGTLLFMAGQTRSSVATDDEFEPLTVTPSEPNTERYKLIPAHEFAAGIAPSWLVKGLIPKAELVVMFGASGSGKSFMALDIAASIATGTMWRSLRVKKGRVIYIAAEGAGGFRNRLKAYEMAKGVPLTELDIMVIAAAPNFLEKQDALDLAACMVPFEPTLVIVDTWAQTTPGGNENSGEDMGKALKNCKAMHHATGATVLLIHHSGKNASAGARGWSGLRAAADAELEVLRNGEDRVLSSTKQKDGEDGAEYGFKLDVIPLGLDEDGDVVSSCVVSEADIVNVKAKNTLGKVEQALLEAAGSLVGLDGVLPDENSVRDSAVELLPLEDEKRDRRKYLTGRAMTKLVEKGLLIRTDGRIQLA